MKLPLWLRRLIRPLIPDRLMARFRLAEHSRQVRNNVDVVVDGRLMQRRWLLATPDTYRVRSRASFEGPVETTVLRTDERTEEQLEVGSGPFVVSDHALTGREIEDLSRAIADPRLSVAVLGETSAPSLRGGRRTEPDVRPRAMAFEHSVWTRVGGFPPGSEPLPGFLDRIRAAGIRYALFPAVVHEVVTSRSDPIDRPSVVILALVPMHDIGGGSRGSQLAQEFLRRGWHVTYVALFGTAESVDLGIRYIHPNLEQRRARGFDVAAHIRRLDTAERVSILEIPARHYLDTVGALRGAGYQVVYDLIDDWTAPALGGRWYEPELERRIVESADVLTASAGPLRERLRELSDDRRVLLMPNAVNAQLFGGDPGPRPQDLPEANGPLICYHGSLYGEWFDWQAVEDVARRFDDAVVVLIGDEPEERPSVPANVHFLGIKPQFQLPAYVARSDVGLVPFVVSDVTHAVSPLKVYEYLACGVRVASVPIQPVEGIPGVTTDRRLGDAVAAALRAEAPDRLDVLRRHSWTNRVDRLLDAVGNDPSLEDSARGSAPEIQLSPAEHLSRAARRSG